MLDERQLFNIIGAKSAAIKRIYVESYISLMLLLITIFIAFIFFQEDSRKSLKKIVSKPVLQSSREHILLTFPLGVDAANGPANAAVALINAHDLRARIKVGVGTTKNLSAATRRAIELRQWLLGKGVYRDDVSIRIESRIGADELEVLR